MGFQVRLLQSTVVKDILLIIQAINVLDNK